MLFGVILMPFSLIICKEHTKRENFDSWKTGPGKATSGYLFYTTPNKLKLHKDSFIKDMRNIGANNYQRGPPGGHNPPGRAREPRHALVVVPSSAHLRCPSSGI